MSGPADSVACEIIAPDLQPIQEITRALELFKTPGDFIEIRTIDHDAPKLKAGYFNSVEDAAVAAVKADTTAKGIYLVFNEIRPDFSEPSPIQSRRGMVCNSDITRRRWILVDIDPERPTSTNSTEEEKGSSRAVLDQVIEFLHSAGYPAPVISDSGNGYHCYYHIDQPNDTKSAKLIKEFLRALDQKFSTPAAKVDIGNNNSGRITKLPGTMTRKGRDTPDRPQRRSHLLEVPDQIETVTREQIEAVAALYQAAIPKKAPPSQHAAQARKDTTEGQKNTGSRREIIQTFKLRYTVQDILGRYCKKESEFRYLSPNSTSGDAGIQVSEDGKFYSHHTSSDPACVADGHQHSSFDALVGYGHAGDGDGAFLEACEMIGMTLQPSGDEITTKDLVTAAYSGQHGLADLFTRAFEGQYILDHASGTWYTYENHSWTADVLSERIRSLSAIQVLLRNAAISQGKELKTLTAAYQALPKDDISKNQASAYKTASAQLKKDRKALLSADHNLDSLPYDRIVLDYASLGKEGIGITGQRWDQDPWVLACDNGIIDLKTGDLRDGKPEDYIRSTSGTAYNPEAACPLWEKFLLEIFDGDGETVSFVQRLLGMGLLGDSDLKQNVFIFTGRGRNGKNSLLDTVSGVIGPQLCTKITSELLLSSKNSRGAGACSPEILGLQGLRLIYASETNEGRSFDVSKVKELSGGGYLRARGVYAKNEVTFKSSHMVILDTNCMPHANPGDYAFFQRLRCINFTLSYVDEPKESFERKKDPHLKGKLATEAPGILAWLIRGCLIYQEHGLQEPMSVLAAVDAYRDSEDLIKQFLTDKCNTSPGAGDTSSKDLYDNYKIWCMDSGVKTVTLQKFGQYMTGRFTSRHTKYGKAYSGVVLR